MQRQHLPRQKHDAEREQRHVTEARHGANGIVAVRGSGFRGERPAGCGEPGLDDPTAVRRLLGAWWAWAGALTARGELADSDVFLAQREAEGLLELPIDVATRAIELELADLHGSARRAGPRARAARRRSAIPAT